MKIDTEYKKGMGMEKLVMMLVLATSAPLLQTAGYQKGLTQRPSQVEGTDRYEVELPLRVRGVDDQPPKGLVTRILECFGYGQTGQGQPEGPVYARRVLCFSRVEKIEDEEILKRLKAAKDFLESFQSAAAASAERIKEGDEQQN